MAAALYRSFYFAILALNLNDRASLLQDLMHSPQFMHSNGALADFADWTGSRLIGQAFAQDLHPVHRTAS